MFQVPIYYPTIIVNLAQTWFAGDTFSHLFTIKFHKKI